MDFGEILTRAWNITWKYKVLWIFGILASCGRNKGSSSGVGGGNSGFQDFEGDINIPPEVRDMFVNIERYFDQIDSQQIINFVAILIIVFLIIWLIMRALSAIGQIGLIQGTFHVEQGTESLAFGELFGGGRPFFWRIYGLNVMIGLSVFVFVVLLIYLAFSGTVSGVGLCVLPFLCLLLPLVLFINILTKQANIAIVIEDLNIIEGLKRGWAVFREHLGNIIVMAFVLGICGIVIGLIFAVPIFLIFIPATLGSTLGGIVDSNFAPGSGFILASLCFVGYLPILLLLDGTLRTYIDVAWTLTYLRLKKPSIELDDDPELLPADQ